MNSQFEISEMMEELLEMLELGTGIAEMSMISVILIITLVAFILKLIFSFILYIVEAIPLYKLGKKFSRKSAGLAWIPIFGKYIRLYCLADLCPEKKVRILDDRLTIKNRNTSFIIYLGVNIFGASLITALVLILGVIPGIGAIISSLSSVLYIIPVFFCGYIEYVYLKDLLDNLRADEHKNSTAAGVITICDVLVAGGLIRSIYLYTLLKYDPLQGQNLIEE